MRRGTGVNVTLVTEGTYPHSYGGVSVWCDQLLRGLPEHRFDRARRSPAPEPSRWCGISLSTSRPARCPCGGSRRAALEPTGPAARRFEWLYGELLDSLLDDPETPDSRFTEVLRELYELSWHRGGRVRRCAARSAVRWLLAAWGARPVRRRSACEPTVHDALTAVDLLEHALRPLFARRRAPI